MITLGIDPGTATTGYGIIKKDNGSLKCVDYGVISTPKDMPFGERLLIIYKEVHILLKKYNPERVAVEDLFFFKNEKTAFKVGQARGVVMLAIEESGRTPFEPTPLQVKQAVSGYGKAGKAQVQKMVQLILNLKEIPKPDDAADALAIAIYCANSMNIKG
ncbi:crossover junction endodeoxyribonuclease RuvC [bacterium]|nr:crossover junction endodeoxyribonuclease RuvC [bacterium]